MRKIWRNPQLETMLLEAIPEYKKLKKSQRKHLDPMKHLEKVAKGDILDHKTKSELMEIYSFGEKSYEAVIRVLEEKGYDVEHLKED